MKPHDVGPGRTTAGIFLYLALVPIALAFLPLIGTVAHWVAIAAAFSIGAVMTLHSEMDSDPLHNIPRVSHTDEGPFLSVSRIHQITAAMQVVTRLGANADLTSTKSAIVEAGRLSLGTDLIALFTIDPYLALIDCDCTKNVTDEMKQGFLSLYSTRMTDLNETAAWVTDIANGHIEDEAARQVLLKTGVMAIAACPIRSESSTCGAMVALYPDELSAPEEAQLLVEVLTAHVTTALSYAASLQQSQCLVDGLYGENQQLTQQATVDGLTQLPNHRTFRQRLNELCAKSLKRDGRPLCLAMVDVDHFKIYNDSHGHPEGDSVLRDVAKLMSGGLRSGDLAARYGGEEFAIVFDGANKESAIVAAERIRKSIADHAFDKGSVTVSMGIAEFPVDTSKPGELVELADKALYHAKSIGRNRVCGWGTSGSISTAAASEDNGNDAAHTISVLVVETAGEACTTEVKDSMGEGSTVATASSVKSALEMLKSQQFDVAIVSDLVLPEIRHLRTIAAIHPNMPLILVADDIPSSDSREALRKGAADILTRPYNPTCLPMVIERNLERRRLELQRLAQKSNGVMLQAIEALVAAIDAKDHYMAGHSQQVTELSMALSELLGMPEDQRCALELASKLHDIGKLALPDSALNKNNILTDDEWQAMREHPAIGAKIVGAINDLAYVSTVIRHHHERLNGTGYPDGLSGAAIPQLSRIIAVADTYEAMTSSRAHRNPMMPVQALAELKREAGKLYDGEIVNVLEKHLQAQGKVAVNTSTAKAA